MTEEEQAELKSLQQTFELRWQADMRAIRKWRSSSRAIPVFGIRVRRAQHSLGCTSSNYNRTIPNFSYRIRNLPALCGREQARLQLCGLQQV